MTVSDFVHLHVHTDYSMLDGAAKISKLVAEAQRLGQKAIAITDHGYLFGAYEFYKTATEAGIKPIIGLEAYVTPGTARSDKSRVKWGTPEQKKDDVSAGGTYTHMTLLAHSTQGMHNLFRMGSYASLEGQMGKYPRIDRELLERYHEGLIGTTGCPSGEVQTRLRLGQWEEARRAAGELQDIFGKENFFVEVMDHGLELERRVSDSLLRLAKELGAPLLATNDSHYVAAEDWKVQDALLCINSNNKINDEGRFKFDGSDYYLRTSEDMRNTFADYAGACDNTLLIAERCDIKFTTTKEGANYMPKFPVPAGEDETSWFVKEVERGLHYRFGEAIPDEVRKQADYEVGIITQMGFPGYFLVVSDFIQWAKEHGIRVGPGRGSGAGSMVAYAMRITELNPLKHGLIFERFLNPDRVSMPDFDVDFDDRRRDEVIQYVTKKYGSDRVAQVVTYGTIKAKQALRDSARILGKPYSMGENLSKAMPPAVMGKDIPISGIFDSTHPRYSEAEEFRKLWNADKEAQEIVEYAKGLEGITRQWGVHACAVIMSSHPLIDIIPIMRRPQDGAIITQFDYPTCETLGLLKMDFLGLRNLTVISDTLENIVINGKEPLDIDSVPLDDKKTYQMLSDAETLGVFQLDGSGMRTLLKQLRPDHFEDISALVALYRPGPMGAGSHTNYALRKNGAQEIEPIHPELAEPLKDILDVSYGLIIYQEQVMAIAQRVAGFTLGQADILRRAMGKKKKAELDKQYANFHDGMVSNGYSEDAIKTLWDILVPFSDYAFNKSHSAAYGLVAYWTAYLKANYPTEYMAALLTATAANKDKMALYLGEARHMGIEVLPPDVSESAANFTPVGEKIRFGLAAIRNVGEAVVDDILAARKEGGKFTSFLDFLDRVPLSVCNKRVSDALIKSGAFDSFGHTRRALLLKHEEAIDLAVATKRQEAKGQFDLFSGLAEEESDVGGIQIDIPEVEEWNRREKLSLEREMLGLYVSDHPLSGVQAQLRHEADVPLSAFHEDAGNIRFAKVAGLITGVVRKTNKNGAIWAILTVEDMTASVEVRVYSALYETFGNELDTDKIVAMEITADLREDAQAGEMPTLVCRSLRILDLQDDGDQSLLLTVADTAFTAATAQSLKKILVRYPGAAAVRLELRSQQGNRLLQLPDSLRVKFCQPLFADIKVLLGRDAVEDPNLAKNGQTPATQERNPKTRWNQGGHLRGQ